MKKIKNVLLAIFALFPFVAFGQWDVNEYRVYGLPEGTIYDIVESVMMWILGIVGFVGIVGFAIAGIIYLTSAGDDEKISKAKKAMTWSIVGIVVALMGFVIIQAVDSMLGGTDVFF
ncbi:MAG: hypothetical protein PHH24_02430 [Candidatus Moranbacteria bacterium]|jgi:hypothetical protein|nr:hypothetical protein [Candidatus Moranbacteria bacterium]MDX9855842.1 hypothetical protein [Candidatus Moranbacteria bacterium]